MQRQRLQLRSLLATIRGNSNQVVHRHLLLGRTTAMLAETNVMLIISCDTARLSHVQWIAFWRIGFAVHPYSDRNIDREAFGSGKLPC